MTTFEETLVALRAEGISLSNLMEGPIPPCWVAIIRKENHLDRVGRGDSPVLAIEVALSVKDMTTVSYKSYRDECAKVEKVEVAPSRDVLEIFMKKD